MQKVNRWFFLALCLLIGCSAQTDSFIHVDGKQAGELLGQQPDLVVLDIRTPKEFGEGHIAGALNIDYYDDKFKQNLSQLDKTKTYLVHCRSGGRSGRSLKLFEELGFENIIHLDGGIKAWKSEGLPLGN